MKSKAGRPSLNPEKGGVSPIVPIRMTGTEKGQFQLAAKKAGLTLSEWIRDRLAKAAKRELK